MSKQKSPPESKPEQKPDVGAKIPRQRSPNYPSIDLKTAVGKLDKLFVAMKRHAVGVDIAVKYMDYSLNSSTGKLALAAMRSFGLFVDEREGSESMVKLSTRALDIVTDYPRDSEEWIDAVKKAAIAPGVHAKLWSKYGASLPPDDELRRYLVRELKFNDNSVGTFIQEYKDTISFAKLTEADIIPEGEGEVDGMVDSASAASSPVRKNAEQLKPPGGFSPPAPSKGLRDFPLYTSSHKGALYVPDRMTSKDFTLLKQQIENSLAVIEATAVE